MSGLALLIRWEIEIFVLVLAAIVAVRLLTGDINTHNLLCGRITGSRRSEDRSYFSPERVQLLIFTLAAALHYLSLVFNNTQPGRFPEVPETWPAVVGGSNLIYLGGKAYARWFATKAPTDSGEQL